MKRILCSLVCLLLMSLALAPSSVDAWPLYLSVFRDLYFSRSPQAKVACAACHPSKSKRHRNHYGVILEEALGQKNVKRRERVRQAMKSIEHLFPGLPSSSD